MSGQRHSSLQSSGLGDYDLETNMQEEHLYGAWASKKCQRYRNEVYIVACQCIDNPCLHIHFYDHLAAIFCRPGLKDRPAGDKM